MGIDVQIEFNGRHAQVTESGELVVAPLKYDETQFVELAEPDTAYNFYEPVPSEQFVITGLNFKADRQVSTTVDAQVIIYEAVSIDTTAVAKVLFQEAMVRGERTGLSSLHILVNVGVWVNAKTDDDDIHMTIMGYYIPVLSI